MLGELGSVLGTCSPSASPCRVWVQKVLGGLGGFLKESLYFLLLFFLFYGLIEDNKFFSFIL